MVALPSPPAEPTRRRVHVVRGTDAPLLWRVLMRVDALVVAATGRLEISGDVPEALRTGPYLLAANHIGNIDALVLTAACRARGIPVRFLATGGLFDVPVLGRALRVSRHIRADRGKATIAEALERVVEALYESPRPVLVYPEGRISLEPGLWPERGKTGVARMALTAGVPVVPVSQWGAHEAMCYGMVRLSGVGDALILARSWLRAVRRRPALRVHFGAPVPLDDLSPHRTGDATRARDRIMRAIASGLAPLRTEEPDEPRHTDPTRPVSDRRSPWRP